jgi:hypothetical protein
MTYRNILVIFHLIVLVNTPYADSVRFGSQAAAQTISLDRLLSGAYQPLAGRFSKAAILSVCFHR